MRRLKSKKDTQGGGNQIVKERHAKFKASVKGRGGVWAQLKRDREY